MGSEDLHPIQMNRLKNRELQSEERRISWNRYCISWLKFYDMCFEKAAVLFLANKYTIYYLSILLLI